jgi:hypothetical protein
VKSSLMSKTAARHFLVDLLSNSYTILICIRNFIRASSQDYCHMLTSNTACLCFVRTFSVLIGRHRLNLFSDPIDRLLAAFVVSAFVGDLRRCRLPASLQESHLICSGSIQFPSAFSGSLSDIFAGLVSVRAAFSKDPLFNFHLPPPLL